MSCIKNHADHDHVFKSDFLKFANISKKVIAKAPSDLREFLTKTWDKHDTEIFNEIRTRNQNNDSPLFTIPTETLFHIYSFLGPNAEANLKASCRLFHKESFFPKTDKNYTKRFNNERTKLLQILPYKNTQVLCLIECTYQSYKTYEVARIDIKQNSLCKVGGLSLSSVDVNLNINNIMRKPKAKLVSSQGRFFILYTTFNNGSSSVHEIHIEDSNNNINIFEEHFCENSNYTKEYYDIKSLTVTKNGTIHLNTDYIFHTIAWRYSTRKLHYFEINNQNVHDACPSMISIEGELFQHDASLAFPNIVCEAKRMTNEYSLICEKLLETHSYSIYQLSSKKYDGPIGYMVEQYSLIDGKAVPLFDMFYSKTLLIPELSKFIRLNLDCCLYLTTSGKIYISRMQGKDLSEFKSPSMTDVAADEENVFFLHQSGAISYLPVHEFTNTPRSENTSSPPKASF